MHVEFDATTSALEDTGDGIISLTHTAAGNDRAAFAGGYGQLFNFNTIAHTSITYGGTGMAEQWDVANGQSGRTDQTNAGYTLAGPATGVQTVTSTINTTTPDRQFLHVITMTAVHQTTPVGTPVTGLQNLTPESLSVTVGSVGADDLVVDLFGGELEGASVPTAGADQTAHTEQSIGGTKTNTSRQLGTAGGVMSWSATDINNAMLGAIAFKPAAAAADKGTILRRTHRPRAFAPGLAR